MDAGVLVMVFSETVRKSSVLASDLTLQSAAVLVPGEAFTLTGDSAVLGQDGTSIRVHMGAGDLNELQVPHGHDNLPGYHLPQFHTGHGARHA